MTDQKNRRPEIFTSRTAEEFEALVSAPADRIKTALQIGAEDRDRAEAQTRTPSLDPNIRYA